LADTLESQIVSELCHSAQLLEVIWAGIPCGTCSRAREIPITIRGSPGPKPLRSAEFPRGLPNLAPWAQLKVSKVNHIYDFVASLIHHLFIPTRSSSSRIQGAVGYGSYQNFLTCSTWALLMLIFIVANGALPQPNAEQSGRAYGQIVQPCYN